MTTENQIPVTMPPGSVVVTPGDMYAEIRDMGKKLDHLASVVDPAFADIRSDMSDHESRIRGLERRVWALAAVAAGSGAGLSQVLPLLTR
jgi:hypothetical protein